MYRLLGGRTLSTPAQRAVRALCVVAVPPVPDNLPSVGETATPVPIQAFVTELAVEALPVTVLHGLARLDAIQGHAVFIGPDIQQVPSELWAVVQRDLLGRTVPEQELIEPSDDAPTGQRGVHLNRETVAGDEIEYS